MKLKRLVLQGFKSFKDRTIVNFDDGITGIVGPNGCGKSNIVDALFWVMGEQSAKHLRGAAMKDLIFSGSTKYSPASWSEVSLILENDTGKHIHIQNKVHKPVEIQLTRKLYRNGETEYRINGLPARLKDIQEVFMDTGAGAKSYSIIAQGEIERLVRAKPQERRIMIEEVAGVTKFKLRKRESLKKIDQTEQNLNRLSDLKIEIEKNLKALQAQSEKAQRARSLKEKVRKHDLRVHSHKEYDLLVDFNKKNVFINQTQLEIQGNSLRKDTLEVSLEEERIKKVDLTDMVDRDQEEFNEISKKLAASTERLNFFKKSHGEKSELKERGEKQDLGFTEEIDERSEKLTSLQTEIEKIESEQKEEIDFELLEEKVFQLKEQLLENEEQVNSTKAGIEELRDKKIHTDNELYQNRSKSGEYAKNLEDIGLEIESIESQNSNINQHMIDERDAVNALAQEIEKNTTSLQDQKSDLDRLNEKVRNLEQSHKEKTKSSIILDSKLNSLREIQRSLEGVKEGTKQFLSSDCSNDFQILGNLIKSAPEHSKAVQALLGKYFDYLVSSQSDLAPLQNWCQNNPTAAVDLLLPLSKNTTSAEIIERLEVNGCEGVVPFEDIVSFSDEHFSDRLKGLLKGLYLIDNFTEELASSIPGEMNFVGLVSTDGRVALKKSANAQLFEVLGDVSKTKNVVDRNNEIELLGSELQQEEKLLQQTEEQLNGATAELEEKRTEYESFRDSCSEQKAEYAARKSSLTSKEDGFKSSNMRLEILINRKSEISKSRLSLLEREEILDQDTQQQEEKLSELQGSFENYSEALEDVRSSYDEARDELNEKQVAVKTFESRLKTITEQIEDIQKHIQRVEERKLSNSELVENYSLEIDEISISIENLILSNQTVVDELQERELALSELKDDLAQLLLNMHERENTVRKLVTSVNSAEKQLVEKQLKLEQIVVEEEELVKNIFEKYQIDMRDVVLKFLDCADEELAIYQDLNDISPIFLRETEDGSVEIVKEDYVFIRKYGQEIRDSREKWRRYRGELQRLGEINWTAVEEYDRQKLRFDFIKNQEEELKQSLEDLQTAINHIDEKSRKRFVEAFGEVDSRFRKVFPIIFGGGCAKLEVVGDINDPEAGIDIMAQPPGKKNQAVNLLSGGEKALTALSLIFSIFLVKPSPFCLLDEVDAPLDDANVGRFTELLREMSKDSQFVLITHNKKTMELNDTLYGITMQEPGVSKAMSVQLQ